MFLFLLKLCFAYFPERELAEKLDVSRNAVREGLKTLEYMDVIEVVKGKGSVIKDIKPILFTELIIIEDKVIIATSPMGGDHTAGNIVPGRTGFSSDTMITPDIHFTPYLYNKSIIQRRNSHVINE